MLSKTIEKAINDQLNFEIFSANIYLSMAAYFDSLNLSGFANWMKVQYQEEFFHAMKFYDYINERGGRVLLDSQPGPPTQWESPLAAFENALAHERIVSSRVNDMVSQAMEEKDHATANFLQWFVGEQVEEEANAEGIIQQLKLMGEAPGGLFMLNRELAQRVFTPPTAGGA
jgi:ferritin